MDTCEYGRMFCAFTASKHNKSQDDWGREVLAIDPLINIGLSCEAKLGLELAEQMVIFALNDNEDPTEAEGGYHWSLLVYSRSALFVLLASP